MAKISLSHKNISGDPLFTRIGLYAGFLYPIFEWLYTSNVSENSMWVTLGFIITGSLIGRKPKLDKKKD